MPSRKTLCETVALFLLLFPLTLLAWSAAPHSQEALASYAVSDALARYGRWDIETVRWLGEPVGVYGPDGLLYARQPPGLSLLALPLAWLGLWVPEVGPLHTALLLPPLLHTLTALFLYHASQRLFPRAGRGRALGITLLWALGSLLFPPTRQFDSTPASTFALTAALHQLLRYRTDGALHTLLACGAWLGLTLLANPALNLLLPPFVLALLYLVHRHWSTHLVSLVGKRRFSQVPLHAWREWLRKDWVLLRLSLFALPLLLVSAFYLWYNWHRFGVPFSLADGQGGLSVLLPLLPLLALLVMPPVVAPHWQLLAGSVGMLGFLLALLRGARGETPEMAWLEAGMVARRPLALLVGMALAGLGAGSWGWRRQGGELVLTAGALLVTTGLWLLLGDLRAFEAPLLREALTTLPEPLPPGAQLWYDGPDLAPALLNQVRVRGRITGFDGVGEELPEPHRSRARVLVEDTRAPVYLLSDGPGQSGNGLDRLLRDTLFFVEEKNSAPHRLTEYWQGRLSVPLRVEQPWRLPEGTVVDVREVRATPLVARGGVLAVELRWAAEQPLPERYQLAVWLENAGGDRLLQKREPLSQRHWQPGRVMVERRAFRVPAELPPGRYTLRLALHPAAEGSEVAIVVTVE